MKPTLYTTALLVGFASIAARPAWSAEHDHSMHQAQAQHHHEVGEAWSVGTVKRIDLKRGKVTIAHGRLPKLNMPPMTMLFKVKDPEWLKQMKPGDRIHFVADQVNGAYTVTDLDKNR